MIDIIPCCDIYRLEENEDAGTFGVLLVFGQVFCCTLEPPDRLNERNRSSIPAQQYMVRKHQSPKFGLTFKIWDVPGRSEIIFHAGNTVEHTSGCILLGQSWGRLANMRGVMNSGQTFRNFMQIMADVDIFKLSIHTAWG